MMNRVDARSAPIPEHLASPDIVLAADCVYFEPAFPLLHEALLRLTEMGNVEVYMAYKKRRKVLPHGVKNLVNKRPIVDSSAQLKRISRSSRYFSSSIAQI